ncbi:hypothetical protein N8I77_005382 [Diaporthe amygdali]|uniref:Centrosomin N-terminal motif 1 domain-containing protein n=1 Tax=Phomopsis amygdali TaxID=1214568 RepID=A0AAD9SFL6_PHOAM|nr:hypothetical protein N8I77_005382 [Diaporthe amygdali]
MEGPALQSPRRERRRPSFHSPNSSRAVSRSSTRNSSARMPPQTNSDSASNLTSSPSLRYAQPVGSRMAHRRGSMGSNTDRPPTPVSKSSVRGSQTSSQQEPTSTLLQEKLQRERRSEIQRNLNRLAGEMNTAADAQQAATSTPVRCATADGKRPESSDTNGDTGKKKGLALKEMEQAMSTLHKQNFDLKLELFHRRERQSVLEDKVETLEADKSQTQETNEMLILELEKRDKAVEEAVTMIVTLEARIELLLREREMVRQVEADKALISKLTAPQAAHRADGADETGARDAVSNSHGKSLARMPSFLSERTENTENLRNVYLGTQGSILSLSRTDPRVDNGGYVSPNMSVLSESSFVSIYGGQAGPHEPVPHAENNSQIDDHSRRGGRRSLSLSRHDSTPTRPSAKEAIENGETTSPLQKLEKLDSSPVIRESSEVKLLGRDIDRPATVKPAKPQPLLRVRKARDKPIPARRVVTDVPTPRAHALPPTPDTMSSSMNHSLCSDDIPQQHDRPDGEATYPVMSRLTLDQTNEIEPGHWRFNKSGGAAQPPSVTAFTGRKDYSAGNHADFPLSLPRRPRSFDETTISRHKVDWDSGSELDDAASEVSSFDYWMREGLRPSRGGQAQAQNGVAVSQRHTSRGTPDLFGFPSDSKGWQSNDMFGALGGNGYLGAAAPLAPALDALGASLPAPEIGTYGSGLAGPISPRLTGNVAAPPPAPNRKSSLRARTSAPGTPRTTHPPRSFGKHSESESSRKSSLTAQAPNSRSITPTPPDRPQAQHNDEGSAQKRHYPPTASHQQQAPARPRSRGITSLFRRSLGSGHIQPSSSAPNNQSPFPPPAKTDVAPPTVGVPMWERRNDRADEETSATPPPIMRKRAPVHHDIGFADTEEARATTTGITRAAKPHPLRSSSPGLGAGLSNVLASRDGGVPLTPNNGDHEQESTPTSGSAPGHGNSHGGGHAHGRKWFGLGRVTSSKHGGT